MKTYIKDSRILASIFAATAIFSAVDSQAQKFAVKAYGDIGLGNGISLSSGLKDLTGESSTDAFGVDFGYRFWEKNRNSLELNVGLGYSSISTKMNLPGLDYSYSAPAWADMDEESYIRYYELENVKQKVRTGRLTIPVYLSYGFRCAGWLGIHADLGVGLGIKASSGISGNSGESFSYGIYPQYDDLMIDAGYMNDFGRREIEGTETVNPEVESFSASLLAGIGAEFKIHGPLSADLSVRYENGFTNLYKPQSATGKGFTAETAPLTYTVADGSRMRSLTDYLTASKLSRLSLRVSLIFRF